MKISELHPRMPVTPFVPQKHQIAMRSNEYTSNGWASPIGWRLPPAMHIWFLGGVGVVTLVYFSLRTQAQSLTFNMVGIAAAGAMFLALIITRPQPRFAWSLLTLGILMMTCGDILYGVSQPVPSTSDILYFSAYALFALGLLGLVRSVVPQRSNSVAGDVGVITIGIALLGGFILLVPNDGFSLRTQAVALGYPLLDLGLIAILARMRHSRRARPPFALLMAGLLLLLVADIGFLVLDYGASYAVGSAADAAWLLAYGCFGAALLHPGHLRRNPSVAPPPPPPQPSIKSDSERVKERLAEMQAEVLKEIAERHALADSMTIVQTQALRFRVVLRSTGWLLQAFAASALLCALSWQMANMVMLAAAYSAISLLLMLSSRIHS